MGKFRVGITRDFLNPDGELKFDIGLDLLDANPNVEYEFFFEFTPEVLPEQIRNFDAVISLTPKYTKDSFKGVDRLTAIARFGVGYDMVDLNACTEAGVMCFITPEAVKRPVAVGILTFILALSTKLFIKDDLVRSNRWNEKVNYMGIGLKNKVVGSVGLGGIAREFFQIAKPLDMVSLAYDPYASKETADELGVQLVDLDTLLRESDFVCINCPLMDSTYHLIGARELSLMKPTAFLINTARGPIIEQAALTEVLQESRIQGAALDVFEQEPIDPADPLLKLDNVILAPHAIVWTDECFRGNGLEDIRGILKVMQGQVPDHVVNKEVLFSEGLNGKLARYADTFTNKGGQVI